MSLKLVRLYGKTLSKTKGTISLFISKKKNMKEIRVGEMLRLRALAILAKDPSLAHISSILYL